MKQLFTSLLAFIVLFSLNAQNYNSKLAKELLQKRNQFRVSNNLPALLKSASGYTQKLVDITTVSADNSATVKIDFSYNDENQMNESTTSMFDSDAQTWKGLTRTIFTYDDAGRLTQEIMTYIDPLMAGLVADTKFDYQYNNKGQLTLFSMFNRTSGTDVWVNNGRSEYLYNNNGLLSEDIHYTHNILTDAIELSAKNVSSYNTAGILTEEDNYIVDPFLGGFTLYSKSEFVFNSEGYIVSQTDHELNDEGVMELSFKIENSFDSYGCISEVHSFTYNSETGIWENDTKSISEYEYSSPVDVLLIPGYFGGMFKYKQTKLSTFTWESNSGSWKNVQNSTYNYSDISATKISENFNSKKADIFPNPTKDFITISNVQNDGRIEIYNLDGQSVLSKNVVNNEVLSVKQLSQGIYLYKLNCSDKIYSGKMVVE